MPSKATSEKITIHGLEKFSKAENSYLSTVGLGEIPTENDIANAVANDSSIQQESTTQAAYNTLSSGLHRLTCLKQQLQGKTVEFDTMLTAPLPMTQKGFDNQQALFEKRCPEVLDETNQATGFPNKGIVRVPSISEASPTCLRQWKAHTWKKAMENGKIDIRMEQLPGKVGSMQYAFVPPGSAQRLLALAGGCIAGRCSVKLPSKTQETEGKYGYLGGQQFKEALIGHKMKMDEKLLFVDMFKKCAMATHDYMAFDFLPAPEDGSPTSLDDFDAQTIIGHAEKNKNLVLAWVSLLKSAKQTIIGYGKNVLRNFAGQNQHNHQASAKSYETMMSHTQMRFKSLREQCEKKRNETVEKTWGNVKKLTTHPAQSAPPTSKAENENQKSEQPAAQAPSNWMEYLASQISVENVSNQQGEDQLTDAISEYLEELGQSHDKPETRIPRFFADTTEDGRVHAFSVRDTLTSDSSSDTNSKKAEDYIDAMWMDCYTILKDNSDLYSETFLSEGPDEAMKRVGDEATKICKGPDAAPWKTPFYDAENEAVVWKNKKNAKKIQKICKKIALAHNESKA